MTWPLSSFVLINYCLLYVGTASAAGGSSSVANSGGGSGGSVLIQTSTISGHGYIEANGGSAVNGGAGGRIAVYTKSVSKFQV